MLVYTTTSDFVVNGKHAQQTARLLNNNFYQSDNGMLLMKSIIFSESSLLNLASCPTSFEIRADQSISDIWDK
jgi:hypothetical protein